MEQDIIANIKSLGLDMINEAGSGHPGIVLSSAPIIYTLYAKHLNVFPSSPDWFNRDRFIMSAGHGSALLYATLFMSGYDLSVDDLKSFRKLNSKTPGHPEICVTPGVECSTGPLGQGIATSVGIAIGERFLNKRYPFYHFNTYVLVGDGDLMEGVSYEACSLAGSLGLSNLIILYDSNDMTLDGNTFHVFNENVRARFESFGFDTFLVTDGNNIDEVNTALNLAKKSDKPCLIEIKTKLGYGSLLEDTNKVHGKPLSADDLKQLKDKLNIRCEPFYVNSKAKEFMMEEILKRTKRLYKKSMDECASFVRHNLSNDTTEIRDLFRFNKYNILSSDYELPVVSEALRDTNHNLMQIIAKQIPLFMGGSADLASSTKVYLDDYLNVNDDFKGRNISFGIREHAMGSIMNGLALLKIRSFGSTFLTFSDYLKPAIRMSCLMKLPVTYIFTHDSVLVGEDGPTHQPIEQLAMLRSIPNLNVYRPSDAKELYGCWQSIMLNKCSPSALVLSKSKVNQKKKTSSLDSLKGGYIVEDCNDADAVIIATGTEVDIALRLKQELDYNIKVVSMPCKEIFKRQEKAYQNKVLMARVKIVIEAGSSYGWEDIADYVIGIDRFGYSAKDIDVLNSLEFDYDSVKKKILKILS